VNLARAVELPPVAQHFKSLPLPEWTGVLGFERITGCGSHHIRVSGPPISTQRPRLSSWEIRSTEAHVYTMQHSSFNQVE
jgi:hypothetical protein